MKKAVLIGLGIMGGLLLLGVALFVLTFGARAAAQDVPPPPPDMSVDQVPQEAKELLRDRSSTSEPDAPGPDQQNDNASSFDGAATTTTRSETVTEESSTSFSVGTPSNDMPPGQPGPGWGSAGPNPVAMLAGRWRLAMAEGSDNCTITLKAEKWSGAYRANVPAGCPKDFFDVSRWEVAGNELRMSTSFGKQIATFYQATPNRFTGSRASDGAGVTLTR